MADKQITKDRLKANLQLAEDRIELIVVEIQLNKCHTCSILAEFILVHIY